MIESLHLEVGRATHPGLIRTENQDTLDYRIPAEQATYAERGALFVVCDGIGGFAGGRVASAFAVDAFTRAYYALPAGGEDPGKLLAQAVTQANTSLYGYARQEQTTRMGTTLVAVVIRGSEMWALNVGDSRAYIWRAGHLHQVTRDHVPAAPGAVRRDRRIDRALGTDPRVAADVFGPLPLSPGDRVLLCTDGLTVPVANPAIAGVLQTFEPEHAANQLVELAKTGGAPDNVTAIVIGVSAAGAERSGTRWAQRVPRDLPSRATGVPETLARFWAEFNPWHLLTADRWRTRQGALALVGWVLWGLLLGIVLGLVFHSLLIGG